MFRFVLPRSHSPFFVYSFTEALLCFLIALRLWWICRETLLWRLYPSAQPSRAPVCLQLCVWLSLKSLWESWFSWKMTTVGYSLSGKCSCSGRMPSSGVYFDPGEIYSLVWSFKTNVNAHKSKPSVQVCLFWLNPWARFRRYLLLILPAHCLRSAWSCLDLFCYCQRETFIQTCQLYS